MKKLKILILLALLLFLIPFSFATIMWNETFIGADGTDLNGYHGLMCDPAGSTLIDSNLAYFIRLARDGICTRYFDINLTRYSNSINFSAQLITHASDLGYIINLCNTTTTTRSVATFGGYCNNGYGLWDYANSNMLKFLKIVENVETEIASVAYTETNGDVLTFFANSSGLYAFVNGSLILSVANDTTFKGFSAFNIYGYAGPTGNVKLDNMVLSYNDINNYIFPTPNPGYRTNQQETISIYCSTGNYTIWFDNNPNPSTKVIDQSLTNNSYTTSMSTEQTYFYIASCDNGATNLTIRNLTYDLTTPTITINSNSFFNSANLSFVDQYTGTNLLTANISIDSINSSLYGFEFNITYPNGTSVFSYRNESLTGLTFNYSTVIINYSTWQADTIYNIDVWASDSHTEKGIADYITKDILNGVEITTEHKNTIKIFSDEKVSLITEKNKDRYNFNMDFDSKGKQKRTLYIETDSKITYLPNSIYKGHFVIGDLKSGNWIDFEGTNEIPKITKISETKYKIDFLTLDDKVIFKSIGGLNTNHKTYTWYKGKIYNNIPNAITNKYTNLSIGVSKNAQIILINSTINYNNTLFNTSKTDSIDVSTFYYYTLALNTSIQITIPVIFNITIHNSLGNYTFLYTTNQLIFPLIFDNCSYLGGVGSTVVLNISSFEENTLIPLKVNITGTFNITESTYTNSWYNISNIQFCVYPSGVNTTLYSYIQYGGAEKERYYIDNFLLTNKTNNIYLYNFDDATGLSQLKLTAKNYYYNLYPGVIGSLQRYYPGTNTWLSVQNDKSDNEGNMIFYVYQVINDYRFFWSIDGVTVGYTAPIKYVCENTGILNYCEQSEKIQFNEGLDKYAGLSVNGVYNNNTKLYSLTWADSKNLVQNIQLTAQQIASNGIISICDISAMSSSGTIICNLSGYNGNIDIQVWADDPVPVFNDKIDNTVRTLSELLSSTGRTQDGVALSFVFSAAVIGIGFFSMPIAIIAAIFSNIALLFLGLNSILTIGIVTGVTCLGLIVIMMIKRY